MRNLLVAVALLVAFVGYSQQTTTPQRKCPADHVFTTCGSACPEACDSDPCRICTEQCVIGCRCREGFVKASEKSNVCVPKKDCPKCKKGC